MLIDIIEILEAASRNETLNQRIRNNGARISPVLRQVAAARFRIRTRLDQEALDRDAARCTGEQWVPPAHPDAPLKRVKPLGEGLFEVKREIPESIDDLMSLLEL